MTNIVPIETITSKIHLIRDTKGMLDSDLAELYGVTTKRFNEQVRRNRERFPTDFMFQLTREEFENLKSQIATSSQSAVHGGRRHLPFIFTEHGAIMAATILNSQRAVETSIFVVRAFVKLREMLASSRQFAARLDDLEKRLTGHDENFRLVFEAIRQLLNAEMRIKNAEWKRSERSYEAICAAGNQIVWGPAEIHACPGTRKTGPQVRHLGWRQLPRSRAKPIEG